MAGTRSLLVFRPIVLRLSGFLLLWFQSDTNLIKFSFVIIRIHFVIIFIPRFFFFFFNLGGSLLRLNWPKLAGSAQKHVMLRLFSVL